MTRLALLLTVVLLAGCGGSTPAGTSSKPVEVGYFVTGSAHGVNITIENSSGGTEQASDRSVPLTSGSGRPGLHMMMRPGSFAYISAQNTDELGTVTCRITFDGVTVKESTSVGAYSIASCSAVVG